jgi:hypothetical protein
VVAATVVEATAVRAVAMVVDRVVMAAAAVSDNIPRTAYRY